MTLKAGEQLWVGNVCITARDRTTLQVDRPEVYPIHRVDRSGRMRSVRVATNVEFDVTANVEAMG